MPQDIEPFNAITASRIKRFLEEATNGPQNGGLAEDYPVNNVTVEFAASFGWGIQFSRTVDGRTISRHLSAADATYEKAVRALREVVAADS